MNSVALNRYIRLSQPIPSGRLDALQPIGGQNGETAFAFVQVTNTTSGNPSLYGVNVQGGQLGQWQRVGYQANVTENVGYSSSKDGSSGTDSSSSSTGLIVGCVLGALVLIIAVAGYFGYYRRVVLKRKKDKAKQGMQSQDSTTHGNTKYQDGKFLVTPSTLDRVEPQKRPYDPTRDGGGPSSTSQSLHSQSLHHPTSYPLPPVSGSLTSSSFTTPSSTSTITTIATVDPRTQQQFRLTSHPRPNFITSIDTTTTTTTNSIDSNAGDLGKATLSTPVTPITPTIFRTARPTVPSPTVLPQIPASTRPKATALGPHSLTSETLSLLSSSPQTITTSSTQTLASVPYSPVGSVQGSQNIPWEHHVVVHNPHTEPESPFGQDRLL